MKHLNKLVMHFGLLLLLLQLRSLQAERNFYVEILSCNHTVLNPLMVKNVGCWAGRQGTLTYFSAEFMLLKQLKNFDIHFRFDMLRGDNTKINLLNMDLNGCKYFEAYYTKNFMQVALRELFRVSNLPHRCPLLAHKRYLVSNYTVDPEDYPPFTPFMTWTMHLGFLLDRKDQGGITLMGKVLKRR